MLVLQTLLIAAFLSILPIHARSSNGGEDIALQQSKLARLPQFCFVVRTYWGHGDAYGGGVWRLLRSLQRQEYDRCDVL